MQPKVTVYISISLDGRINGFETNKKVYKQIKSYINTDAVVMDVPTFNNRLDTVENTQLLVVIDSLGNIPYKTLTEVSSSMNLMLLCTRSTPQDYLNFLEENLIKYMIVGYDDVKFATAFEELNIHFGVKNIAVHCDGVLNGELMADDLVEEISVFIHPTLVGANLDSMYIPNSPENQKLDLRLIEVQQMENEIIYLNYRIMKYKF